MHLPLLPLLALSTTLPLILSFPAPIPATTATTNTLEAPASPIDSTLEVREAQKKPHKDNEMPNGVFSINTKEKRVAVPEAKKKKKKPQHKDNDMANGVFSLGGKEKRDAIPKAGAEALSDGEGGAEGVDFIIDTVTAG